MRIKFRAFVVLALLAPASPGGAQGARYRLDKIADGVLLAVPAESPRGSANIPVIVTAQDIVLVGSHFTPVAARGLIEQLKTVSDKPVRFIVNTHYHTSQSAPKDPYPMGVDVIGHELARRTLLFDARGRPRPANAAGTPPTLGMTTRLSLYRGDREIRILYVGRGHSDSDIVVFLPKEKILCSGELLVGVLPDMADASITDWISTLEALKTVDFETVLPARGAPFTGKDKVSALQSYLRDVLVQTTDLLNKGISVQETARRVDLTPHKKDFPEIQGPGVDVNAVKRLQTQIEEPEPLIP
jgi:glyoxylase-like metal-dependent hydrolase (beta-lactamase superfamily II)